MSSVVLSTRTVAGFLGGAVAVVAVTVVRLWISPLVGADMALILYLLAVLLAAWLGGATAGISTTLLSLVAGVVFIIGPTSFSSSIVEGTRVAIFAIEGVVVSLAIDRLRHRTDALHESVSELVVQRNLVKRMALEDVLTGLGNRRAFEGAFERLLAQSSRTGEPLTIAMADVDGLKRTNDAHGHAEGDALLVAVAEALREGCRTADAVYRLGGDEFALLLPDTDRDGFEAVTPRLEDRLREVDVRFRGTGLSIGAAHAPVEGTDARVLLRLADSQMYAAKLGDPAAGGCLRRVPA